MREDLIDRLRRVLAAASPGPWSRVIDEEAEDVRVCRTTGAPKGLCVACVAIAGETIDGIEWTPETIARWRADALAIAALGTLHPELLAIVDAARAMELGTPPCEPGCTACSMARAIDALDSAIERALPGPE